jgi:hypothetical protein
VRAFCAVERRLEEIAKASTTALCMRFEVNCLICQGYKETAKSWIERTTAKRRAEFGNFRAMEFVS